MQYSYDDKVQLGPKNWGHLTSAFELCEKGAQQSPINIQTNATAFNSSIESLKRDYIAANATLIANGHNLGVRKNLAFLPDATKDWYCQFVVLPIGSQIELSLK